MSIWITGDCHSDFHRFTTDSFYEQTEFSGNKDENFVIICGDFGGVWYQEGSEYIKKEDWWLDWLEDKPWTTLFVDGNHENFDRLYQYPVKEWHGGLVHEIRPHVLHLIRGEVFTIEGKKFFAFGGASSHDIKDGIIDMDEDGEWRKIAKQWDKENKSFRIRHLTWWDRELPSSEEMQNGIDNLTKHKHEVDFIISHCAPQSVTSVFSHGLYKPDIVTAYFNNIAESTKFTKWIFGHYHDNRQIMGKYIMLYEQIVRIN